MYSKINIAASSVAVDELNVDPWRWWKLGTPASDVEIVRAAPPRRFSSFDEPTVLTPEETQHLFHCLHIKERGAGVISSPCAREALEIADRIRCSGRKLVATLLRKA